MTPYEKRAVNWLMRQLGLTRRCIMPGRPSHLTEAQKAEVREAASIEGRARIFRELADRFKVSPRTIYRVARQNARLVPIDITAAPATVSTTLRAGNR